MLCWHKLTLSLTVEATELFEVRWKQLIFSFPFRMWRNEVNMRKRERTRQQAEELRKMQKLFLLKAMSSPGRASGDSRGFSVLTAVCWQGKLWPSSQTCAGTAVSRQNQPPDFTPQPANYPGFSRTPPSSLLPPSSSPSLLYTTDIMNTVREEIPELLKIQPKLKILRRISARRS